MGGKTETLCSKPSKKKLLGGQYHYSFLLNSKYLHEYVT